MADPVMPTELWMLWCPNRGEWAPSIDDAPDGRSYLVCFSEAEAINAAWHQNDTYFANEECVPVRIKPTPGPATRAALDAIELVVEQGTVDDDTAKILQAFIEEWPAPAPSPWRCRICGGPVRLGDDLKLRHVDTSIDHEAELTLADLKRLNDELGLRL